MDDNTQKPATPDEIEKAMEDIRALRISLTEATTEDPR